jgi:hypothetical protein
MTSEELIEHFPVLYHVAARDSWPSIAANGLLSTSAILDRLDVEHEQRRTIEERQRPESVVLVGPDRDRFVIRDQKPLHDGKLAGCLQDDLTVTEWHLILNRKVFFWVRPHRFERLLAARAYRAVRHTIISVDTARLVEQYEEQIRLSPMNSGSTSPMAHPRGRDTFRRISCYPFQERRRSRGLQDAIAELTVEYEVADVDLLTTQVKEVGGGSETAVLWESDN